MKKIVYLAIVLLSCSFISLQAHQKEHLTLKDTFWGNEDAYQICYPKDHRTYFYLIIGFGVVSTFLGTWIILLKTKNNKILQEKNALIEEKNNDLVGSIEYAKRIQRSLLPTEEYISNLNQKLFVVYLPKDIVSGDFYWIYKHNHHIFYAVIDCTGHGVPGALLSLIGHNGLYKSIVEKGLTNPTEILNSMNDFVKTTLKQKETNSLNDGMEVALCCLDTETSKLMYAGANLNLYLVQNNILAEIKASRCTVGSVQSHVTEPPITTTIQLQKNDSFYMTTDGFIDQFGGNELKKKKYSSKQFKQLLSKIASSTIEIQRNKIIEQFTDWKKNENQVDDVCVLGVTI